MNLKDFGLREGQMRGYGHLIHNGGWYNTKGEKIGWGDLDSADLLRLSRVLPKDEVFYVLSEMDSFWNFVTDNPGPTGEFCLTSSDEKNPGLEYVRERASWAVVNGEIYSISTYNHSGKVSLPGLEFTAVRSVRDIPNI